MRWYFVMIPFLSVFLFAGFKWQVYNTKIYSIDAAGENTLYKISDISKLRNYDGDIYDEDFINQIIKYVALDEKNHFDTKISYRITNQNPLAIDIKIETDVLGSVISITKSFILDTTE